MSGAVKVVASRARPLIGGVVAIAVIGIVFFVVLPSIASWRDVWQVAKDISWQMWLALLASAALNIATFAPPWVAAMPGLPYRSALAVTLASTASTYVVPGGPAVGMGLSFAMLRGWGYQGRPVTVALTVATIWNQLVIYGTPAVALALLTATGGTNPLLTTLTWVGLLVFTVIVVAFAASLFSRELAHGIGDLAAEVASRALRAVRRGPVSWGGNSFVRFRREAIGLLSARWHLITLATLAGHLSVWLVLVVSLRAVGVSGDEVSLIESFAAWSVVRVLGAIPIVPGGFGIVELGLTGLLVGFGGSNAEVVAAVMIYRVMTVVPPLLFGLAAGLTWRRHNPGWQSAQAAEV
jgi:uncharacterized membrane protein YbhN (UPF0104 family)